MREHIRVSCLPLPPVEEVGSTSEDRLDSDKHRSFGATRLETQDFVR